MNGSINMTPDWVLNFNLLMNIFGLFGVGSFIVTYGRVKFERTRLGQFLMSGAVAVFVLGSAAGLRRLGQFNSWEWTERWYVALSLGIAWFFVASAYLWFTKEVRQAQREKREYTIENLVLPMNVEHSHDSTRQSQIQTLTDEIIKRSLMLEFLAPCYDQECNDIRHDFVTLARKIKAIEDAAQKTSE